MAPIIVTAHPTPPAWRVDVPDVGSTQASSLAEAEAKALDLIAVETSRPLDRVRLHVNVATPAGVGPQFRRIRTDRAVVASRLADAGWSGPDIAYALGMTDREVTDLVTGPDHSASAGDSATSMPSLIGTGEGAGTMSLPAYANESRGPKRLAMAALGRIVRFSAQRRGTPD